jgi:hypothetical protein
MIATIAGSILLGAPFLPLGKFQDKKRGFIHILFLSLLFYTILALMTQIFGLFY